MPLFHILILASNWRDSNVMECTRVSNQEVIKTYMCENDQKKDTEINVNQIRVTHSRLWGIHLQISENLQIIIG